MYSQPTIGHKVAAEFLGTYVLVLFGVGAAVMSGGDYLTTGLAFGLSVLVMASAVGRVSGGHFNPAVTLGAAVSGRLEWAQVPVYWAAQLVGGVLGAGTLYGLLQGSPVYDVGTMGMGANGYGDLSALRLELWAALVIEALMTCLFLWVILAVTDSRTDVSAVLAPAAIGLMLALIHLASISATGTSVNPARSLGPALFVGGEALSQLWVFFVAPLLGAAIAGLTYGYLFGPDPGFDAETPEEPYEDLER